MSTHTQGNETRGLIGRVYEDCLPVIYRFENGLPDSHVRNHLEWLTVISWRYDGGANNGMPLKADNERMLILENTIESEIERYGFLRHVYSRTGNNLKELVYYAKDREQFLRAFNHAVRKHPDYPIEIRFYLDKDWEDFQGVLNDFS